MLGGAVQLSKEQRIGPSQKNEVDELANLISDLIAERIRYQEEQRQRERELSGCSCRQFQDQSGTDYILCNGPINEARYRLEGKVCIEVRIEYSGCLIDLHV
uniref:Zpr1 domain-containing protein n=1 Tax=Loa loa TaxID=7209 RepID=A0A1I7VRJ0_LOALO